MSILNGFIRTKRYRKLSNNNYQLQSELTMSDSVEWEDGTTLTEKVISIDEAIQNLNSKVGQDSNGNNIVDTYATINSLGTQATYVLDGTTLYITTK